MSLAAALLLLGRPAAAAPEPERPAAAGPVHSATLTYELYTIGLHPLDMTVSLALDGGRYDIAVQGETKGIVNFFVGWVSQTVVAGRLAGHRPVPQRSDSLNRFHGKPRRVILDYATGQPVATIDPPQIDDDREPVTAEQQKNTVDSVSAVLDLIQRVAQGEGCSATERVFDGRRRFDVIAQDRGELPLEQNRHTPYQGMAHVCDFSIEKIAGFNRKAALQGSYDQAQPEHVVYRSWSMPVLAGLPAIPVRIRGEGSLGAFTLYLTGVVRGTPRPRLAELD